MSCERVSDIVEARGSIELLDERGACVLRYGGLVARDATGTELPARLRFDGDTIALEVDDARALYPLVIDPLMFSPAWTGECNQAFAIFGCAVAPAGDVNGDGYSDVIVGAYGYDNGQMNEGRAFVYLGAAGGLAATPSWTAESDRVNASFGYTVCTAGDVNGDGFSDVIIGASPAVSRVEGGLEPSNGGSEENATSRTVDDGAAYVYLGSSTGLLPSPSWMVDADQAGSFFASAVATAGDVNGDGWVRGRAPGPRAARGRRRGAGRPSGSPSLDSFPCIVSHLPIRSKRHKEIGYSLPEAATVRLVVYDVLGRERAVLDEGMRGAGRHALRWDGRGSSGVALGQGVYLVRLVAGSRDEARKLIIAR